MDAFIAVLFALEVKGLGWTFGFKLDGNRPFLLRLIVTPFDVIDRIYPHYVVVDLNKPRVVAFSFGTLQEVKYNDDEGGQNDDGADNVKPVVEDPD